MIRRAVLILSTIIIVGSFMGCPRVQKKTIHSSTHDQFSKRWSNTYEVEWSDTGNIVKTMCSELGLTLENEIKGDKHYTWVCRTPADVVLEIQVQPLVKGESYVTFYLHGEDEGIVYSSVRFVEITFAEIERKLRSER